MNHWIFFGKKHLDIHQPAISKEILALLKEHQQDQKDLQKTITIIMVKHFFVIIGFFFMLSAPSAQAQVLVEAESFQNTGGWVIDQQFIEIMGSPYLLAHGMGKQVNDAVTTVSFPSTGNYHVWVRTKDWAPFPTGPGKFKLEIDEEPLEMVFGNSGNNKWRWYYGNLVHIDKNEIEISLNDLTGFEGRCDAIYFTKKKNDVPPNSLDELAAFRKEMLGLPDEPKTAGNYDMVVIGGGIAGICAAVNASRHDLKVALIQNRPVLGGNNSSEIRVHLKGNISRNHYPSLGRIVRELDNGDPGNAHVNGKEYGDRRKEDVVNAEKNIDLFLNHHADKVVMDGSMIAAVEALNIKTNERVRFNGKLFADCTGDGTIGYLAGADYRLGRESKDQTGESMAAGQEDEFTMGFSNLWNAVDTENPSDFPETPWALPFSEEYHWEITRADWRWETGWGNFDPIREAEKIRDHNFRAIYGNWSYLKNNKQDKYANWELNWVAYIAGKRESRRLMGDIILDQHDLMEPTYYDDGFVTTGWDVDLHFPDSLNSKYYPGQEFISWYEHPKIEPYPVPYRCLYSRNVENLFMAGRNISVTHVALGTVRVMRTTGMMGELVGFAAYLCRKNDALPRGIYEDHLQELKDLVTGKICE